MKHSLSLLIIASLVLLSGCISTVRSKKAPDFTSQLDKIYIILKTSYNTGDFDPKFSETFQDLLSTEGIKSEIDIIDPSSEEKEQEEIDRLFSVHSNRVLLITQSISVTLYKGYYSDAMESSAGEFIARLYNGDKDHPVWVARIRSQTGGYGNIEKVAKLTAKQLFKKLQKDKII